MKCIYAALSSTFTVAWSASHRPLVHWCTRIQTPMSGCCQAMCRQPHWSSLGSCSRTLQQRAGRYDDTHHLDNRICFNRFLLNLATLHFFFFLNLPKAKERLASDLMTFPCAIGDFSGILESDVNARIDPQPLPFQRAPPLAIFYLVNKQTT